MEGGSERGRKQVFSWDDFPADISTNQRYALWRDTYTSRYGAADFAPREDRPYFADCEFIQVGRIGVTSFDCSMQYFKRTAANVAADARDDFLIGFNLGGAIKGYSGRRDFDMPRGSAAIFSNAEPMDHRYEGRVKILGLSLPRSLFATIVALPEHAIGRINTETPAAQHLRRYADFLLGDDAVGRDPELLERNETMLLDLIALTIGAQRDVVQQASMRGLRGVRLHEVLREIKSGYTRADFSPSAVARKLGLSPRYVQDLLQETGATFTERVLELRLQKARTMLLDLLHDRMKISDIALASGFGDVSYFNQAFRRRFGCSPTQYRGGNGAE